jgi:hypothetical protein
MWGAPVKTTHPTLPPDSFLLPAVSGSRLASTQTHHSLPGHSHYITGSWASINHFHSEALPSFNVCTIIWKLMKTIEDNNVLQHDDREISLMIQI